MESPDLARQCRPVSKLVSLPGHRQGHQRRSVPLKPIKSVHFIYRKMVFMYFFYPFSHILRNVESKDAVTVSERVQSLTTRCHHSQLCKPQ